MSNYYDFSDAIAQQELDAQNKEEGLSWTEILFRDAAEKRSVMSRVKKKGPKAPKVKE